MSSPSTQLTRCQHKLINAKHCAKYVVYWLGGDQTRLHMSRAEHVALMSEVEETRAALDEICKLFQPQSNTTTKRATTAKRSASGSRPKVKRARAGSPDQK